MVDSLCFRVASEYLYVSGFEKRDHFALCIKRHYRQKQANELCFQ